MDRFIDSLFHDPILLVASIVFMATIGILVWAINAWRNDGLIANASLSDDEEQPALDTPSESTGLLDARLHEISNQLGDISARIHALETRVQERREFDKTQNIPAAGTSTATSSVEVERIAKRLESKIEALSLEKSQISSDSITRVESRLEGIHKLLVLLTEGDGSSAQK